MLPDWLTGLFSSMFGTSQNLKQPLKEQTDAVTMDRQVIVKNLVDSLNKLDSVEYEENPKFYYICENVLKDSYVAGVNNVDFGEKEQLEIGSLLNNNIKKIDTLLFKLGGSFDADRAPSALIFRSGLQYILENFKGFPTGSGGTLEKSFNYFQETETLQDFDQALKNWKEDTTVNWEGIDHKKEDIERPSGVPESHKWWY